MKNEHLILTEKINDGVCRFAAKGRVDSISSDMLLSNLEKALNEGQKTIILDMSQIIYLSSMGIRVILKVYKKAMESGGSFYIEHPSNVVENVLGMTALKEILTSS
jgi:anti-anti-sigma factor